MENAAAGVVPMLRFLRCVLTCAVVLQHCLCAGTAAPHVRQLMPELQYGQVMIARRDTWNKIVLETLQNLTASPKLFCLQCSKMQESQSSQSQKRFTKREAENIKYKSLDLFGGVAFELSKYVEVVLPSEIKGDSGTDFLGLLSAVLLPTSYSQVAEALVFEGGHGPNALDAYEDVRTLHLHDPVKALPLVLAFETATRASFPMAQKQTLLLTADNIASVVMGAEDYMRAEWLTELITQPLVEQVAMYEYMIDHVTEHSNPNSTNAIVHHSDVAATTDHVHECRKNLLKQYTKLHTFVLEYNAHVMKMVSDDIAHFDAAITEFLPDMQSLSCQFLAAHVIERLANSASLDRDTYQTYKRAVHQAAIDILGIDMPRKFCVSSESTGCVLNASDDWAEVAASLVSDYTTRVEALQRYMLYYLVHKSRYLLALARLSHFINRFEDAASRLIIQATEWKPLKKQVRFRRTADTSDKSKHNAKNKSTKDESAALLQSVSVPHVAANAIESNPLPQNITFDTNYNNAKNELQNKAIDSADLQNQESTILTDIQTPKPLPQKGVIQNKSSKQNKSYYTIDESLAFCSETGSVSDTYSKANYTNYTNLKSLRAMWPRKYRRGHVSGLTFVTRSRKKRNKVNTAGTKSMSVTRTLHTATDEGHHEFTNYQLPSEISSVPDRFECSVNSTESHLSTGICDGQRAEVQPVNECGFNFNLMDTQQLTNGGFVFADDVHAWQSKQVQPLDSSVRMPQIVSGCQSIDETEHSSDVPCSCDANQGNVSCLKAENLYHPFVQSGQGSDLYPQSSAHPSSDCNADNIVANQQSIYTNEAEFTTKKAEYVNCASCALSDLHTSNAACDDAYQASIVGCVRDTVSQPLNGGDGTELTTALENKSCNDSHLNSYSALNLPESKCISKVSIETDAVLSRVNKSVNNSMSKSSIDAPDTNSTGNSAACLTKTKKKRAKKAKKPNPTQGGNDANIETDEQPGQIQDTERNVANNQLAARAPAIDDPLAALTSMLTLLKNIVSRSIDLDTGLDLIMPDLKFKSSKYTSISSANDPVVQTIMPILEVVNPATSKRTQINPRALMSAVNCMSESVSIPKEELSLLLVRLKVLSRCGSKKLSFYWTTDIDNAYRYILNHKLATGLTVTMEEAKRSLNLTKTECARLSSVLPNLQMHNELLLFEHIKRGVSLTSGVIRAYNEFMTMASETVTVYNRMHGTCSSIVDQLMTMESPKLAQSLLQGYSTKSLSKKVENDKASFAKFMVAVLQLIDDLNGIVMLTSRRAMLDRLRDQPAESYNNALFVFACNSDAAFEQMDNSGRAPVDGPLVDFASKYEKLADTLHVSAFVSFASNEIQTLVSRIKENRDEAVMQSLAESKNLLVSWKDAAADRSKGLVSAAQKALSLIPNELRLLVYSMLNLNKSTGALHSAMRNIHERYLKALDN